MRPDWSMDVSRLTISLAASRSKRRNLRHFTTLTARLALSRWLRFAAQSPRQQLACVQARLRTGCASPPRGGENQADLAASGCLLEMGLAASPPRQRGRASYRSQESA